MIERRAPGKLFVAGEYAVVEPGEPAVLVAVDRFVTVRLAEAAEGQGRLSTARDGGSTLSWSRGASGRLEPEDGSAAFAYVVSAIRVVEELAAARGIPPATFELSIASELDDPSGRKLGLGSSAAVVVATVRAVAARYGLALRPLELLKLALLATWAVHPLASGGDVAASVYAGWIRYSSPDRGPLLGEQTPVAQLLQRDWPGLRLQRLRPPRQLRLLVGWTGEAASTIDLVGAVRRGSGDKTSAAYAAFLARSRGCVQALCDAFGADDLAGAQDALRGARAALRELAAQAGVRIETPALTLLCDSAEQAGAAGKPSGAGGGDCGIVLAGADTDVEALRRLWRRGGIVPLELSAHEAEPAERGGEG